MRIVLKAVVDLGSKAARLLIAEVDKSNLQIHSSKGFLTMLGQNLDHNALNRLNNALRAFAYLTDRAGIKPEEVIAYGTEVFRRHPELCYRVQTVFPQFRVITGVEEARLSFASAVLSKKELEENQRIVVVDQGGGSLELSYGYKYEELLIIEEALSFPNFGTFNYPEDRRRFAEELILKLPNREELMERRPKGVYAMVGMGSVITQLAFLLSAKPDYRIEDVNGLIVRRQDIRRRARKQQSIAAFLDVLDHFFLSEMYVSGWGIRHGALFADRILIRK